ncbi:MAG: hypothetical protein AB1467_06765 [Candidatus Diapherotrites archaeon]
MPDTEQQLNLIIDEWMNELADYIFSKSQENIIKNGSIDTGFMLQQANIQRELLEKKIVYSAPYAVFIEFGTSPHPMYSKWLEKWVERKLSKTEKEIASTAFAIAKKIEKEGMKEKPFLRPAIDEAITHFKSQDSYD